MLYVIFLIALLQCGKGVIGQEVNLTMSRDNQRLDVTCAFPGTHVTSTLSHVSSLVLSRVTRGHVEVMATASTFSSTTTPQSQSGTILGAHKTWSFSVDAAQSSHVTLSWGTATKALEGTWRCELHGFDSHNAAVTLSANQTLTLTDVDPALTQSPGDITAGLTRMFTLNCSVTDPSKLGMSAIIGIDMKATRHGQGFSLSSANVFRGEELFPGSESANVTSELKSKPFFLAMSYPHPTSNLTGRYICEVTGISSKGKPINFVRYIDIDISDPTSEQLVANIHNWESKYEGASKQLQSTLEKLQHMNFSRQIVRKCDELVYKSGRYPIILTVGNGTKIKVLCEVEQPGKVWTVFQRRFDGSVDFDQSFSSYENGFGSVNGEFWTGLRDLKTLMGDHAHKLRVKVVLSNGTALHQNYSNFTLGDGPAYTLHIQGGSHEQYGMYYNSNGAPFSAEDHGSYVSCASNYGGGWWFKSTSTHYCYNNLNGHNRTSYGMSWMTGARNHYLRETEMMFRHV